MQYTGPLLCYSGGGKGSGADDFCTPIDEDLYFTSSIRNYDIGRRCT